MTIQELKRNRTYGPNVRLLFRDGRPVVEKTYRGKVLPVRMLGFVLISWERFIYNKLRGIEGIPESLPSPDRLSLVTGFMGGENLKVAGQAPGNDYFDSLKTLISRMHGRGVIHLDLRNRRNYGIDDQGNPYLVDFATCLYLPWEGKVKKIFEAIDWMGFAKVKQKLRPELMNESDRNLFSFGNNLSSLWVPTKIVRGIKKCAKYFRGNI